MPDSDTTGFQVPAFYCYIPAKVTRPAMTKQVNGRDDDVSNSVMSNLVMSVMTDSVTKSTYHTKYGFQLISNRHKTL